MCQSLADNYMLAVTHTRLSLENKYKIRLRELKVTTIKKVYYF